MLREQHDTRKGGGGEQGGEKAHDVLGFTPGRKSGR